MAWCCCLSATEDPELQIYSDTENFEDCLTLDSHHKEAPTEAGVNDDKDL